MMTIHNMLLVLSNPAVGQEDAYNRWYDETHLPEVLQVPGIIAAQRFAAAPGEAWAYAATYEIQADDPRAVVAEVMARVTDGRIVMTDAFDTTSFKMLLLTPHGPRVTG